GRKPSWRSFSAFPHVARSANSAGNLSGSRLLETLCQCIGAGNELLQVRRSEICTGILRRRSLTAHLTTAEHCLRPEARPRLDLQQRDLVVVHSEGRGDLGGDLLAVLRREAVGLAMPGELLECDYGRGSHGALQHCSWSTVFPEWRATSAKLPNKRRRSIDLA